MGLELAELKPTDVPDIAKAKEELQQRMNNLQAKFASLPYMKSWVADEGVSVGGWLRGRHPGETRDSQECGEGKAH